MANFGDTRSGFHKNSQIFIILLLVLAFLINFWPNLIWQLAKTGQFQPLAGACLPGCHIWYSVVIEIYYKLVLISYDYQSEPASHSHRDIVDLTREWPISQWTHSSSGCHYSCKSLMTFYFLKWHSCFDQSHKTS